MGVFRFDRLYIKHWVVVVTTSHSNPKKKIGKKRRALVCNFESKKINKLISEYTIMDYEIFDNIVYMWKKSNLYLRLEYN